MDPVYYKNWPTVRISVTAYLHQLKNYRYHWHESEYELDIVLTGRAQFVRGDQNFTLESGDMILINPGVGHASFSLIDDTSAMVIRITKEAFERFLELGKEYRFDFVTDSETRDTSLLRQIRYYSTLLLKSLQDDTVTSETKASASLELLTAGIADHAPFQIISRQREDLFHKEAIRVITSYLEEHYREKVSLDDLAKLTKYNRTYISTIFHKTVGIRFYDYLIRIRITNALYELADDTKTLTDVALDSGFPDLKNFSRKFRETIHVTPARYREVIRTMEGEFLVRNRRFYTPDDELVRPVLEEYLDVFG